MPLLSVVGECQSVWCALKSPVSIVLFVFSMCVIQFVMSSFKVGMIGVCCVSWRYVYIENIEMFVVG